MPTTAHPESSAVTFILLADKLVTLRYADPVPFNAFHARREANLARYQTPGQFLAGVVDAVIERIADILEGVGTNLDGISMRVFEPDTVDASGATSSHRFAAELTRPGAQGTTTQFRGSAPAHRSGQRSGFAGARKSGQL